MLERFKNHISEHFNFLRESVVIVACSGGVDSIVLLHLLKQVKISVVVAHCNFGLRGVESDEDEIFVKSLAKKYNVPHYSIQFNTQEYSAAQKMNTQLAARELRYSWFNDLCTSNGYQYVATGHHADDALETLLINLSRGTGIAGLSGIPAVNKNIVRPLLPFSQQEIIDFAKQEKLEWREDSSNEKDTYLRNKIRHHISPLLKETHPTFLQNVLKTQAFLKEDAAIIQHHIVQLEKKLFQKSDTNADITISIPALKELQQQKTNLYYLFSPYGFHHTVMLQQLLNGSTGKELVSKTHRLIKNRNQLILQVVEQKDKNVVVLHNHTKVISEPLALSIKEVTQYKFANDNKTIFVDKDLLQFPLRLRKWERGDYFFPLGMQGKKKVAKYFKDEKYSLPEKELQWLLVDKTNTIIWIIGKRQDARFKVTDKTAATLKINTTK